MEVVASVLSIIGSCCSLHEIFRRNYKHLRTPKRSIQRLNNLWQQLDARKEDVEREVNNLWHIKGAGPTNECNLWFKRVDQAKTEVSSLMDENGPHRPTKGCCFICSRIKLGKLIEDKIRDIHELLQNVPRLEDSIAIPVNKRGDVLSAAPMMECETHKQIFMKIWGFLHDVNARRVGVWGMGGAGKTTIMSEIHNRLVRGSNQFNCIIWVEASKDLKKVQQDIAAKLGLTFQETDDGRARASKLLEAFNRMKKTFAVVFDDVWEPFSIEEVGIPMPTVENGCKLAIITRSLMMCRGMETDKDVEVKVLEEDEAWNLFKDRVGEHVLSDQRVRSIAKDVAKECGGLPLAIVAVGRALRNTTDIREWENALEELRTSSTGIYNFDEVVCSRLKLSYSKLKDDTRRSCFLFCALYPKGHLIDENELINYWMWEDLLGGVSMPAMKRKGQMIIDELKSASLLELKLENGVRCVKLHDLIRDMVVTIMSTKPRCIVNAGIGQVKPPLPHEWKEDVQWASLMRNDVKSIDFSPMCPTLTSLLLQYNSFEKHILDNFFDNMHGLKVLNLSYTGLSSLPISLSNLENLRALICSHCWNLVEVPSLARLTKLEHLDFSFCRGLTVLPERIEQLSNLRHLDFSFTSVQNLEDGVIANFTLLEDLLILGSHMIGVSSKEDTKKCSYPVRVKEIVSCHKLSVVHMELLSVAAYKEMVKCLKFSQLKEFKLVVGFRGEIPELFEKTCLAIDMSSGAGNLSEAEITKLIPRNVTELVIRNSENMIKRLSLHLVDAKCLKTCTIRGCFQIECILEAEENNMPWLERMNLYNLPKLRMICGEVVKPRTLMNLKSIHVERCSLKCLFPRQLMHELRSLAEITIVGCWELEEIIGERNTNAGDSSHAAKVILPKLQRLKLHVLPNLKSICNGDIQCDSLSTIEVIYCNDLNKLPLGLFGVEAGQQMSASTTLEKITCEEEWWESLQWDQPQAKHLLQPYFVDRYSRDRFAPSSSNTA